MSTQRFALRPRLTVALLLASVLALPGSGKAQESAAAGHWEGSIELPGQELQVALDLVPGESGEWRGAIDIPAQGVSDRRLSRIRVAGDSVGFSISGVPGDPTFRGVLDRDTARIAGKFTQSGQRFPFRLERAGEAELPAAGPSAGEALEGYGELVREALEAWNVPGVAVAIVRDGEVVLAEGYGVRDRESGDSVTANTVFPIGSSTKAFTSLVLGTLVGEGELTWDAAVRDHLPEFTLEDDYASRHATVVDLLSHQTGLPRHDMIWLGADGVPFSRAEIVRGLRHLEPTAELRQRFQYNNLMYAAAGYLAGRVAESTWESLIRERVLRPLGMERTTLSVDSMLAVRDRAVGYREVDSEETEAEGSRRRGATVAAASGVSPEAISGDTAAGKLVPMEYRPIDPMGPAGSINSSAAEMARWVRLHLGGGKLDGERIAPAAAVRATHEPRVVVRGGLFSQIFSQPEMPHLMYGLGWMVQPYRGHELIHHGGNIDGFSALVSFMPREEIGVVVLANKNGTLMTNALTFSTYDRLLGLEPKDWNGRYRGIMDQVEEAQRASTGAAGDVNRKRGTSPSHGLSAYAGTYTHPGYGHVRVTSTEDGLRIRFHGLEFPLEHWHYDTFAGEPNDPLLEGLELKFHFHTNGRGDVAAVEVPLQAGVDPVRFERQPPERMSDPAFLQRFAGDYALMGLTVTARLRGDRLVLDLPGQPAVELLPYRGTQFDVKGQPGASVKFVVEDGDVARMLFIQAGQVLEAERTEGG